ncbi:hypothetical protein AVEN_32206-1 [Araneus ventricosus]|uniref:Uncharacterized protein n=1 Tax=Araneus ventricosus TaxID=182803 RepID=A0A4Y2CLZ7_ARAVE|nr:hypothetical protein AVEN_32206-1 [Araneus ventricosus]
MILTFVRWRGRYLYWYPFLKFPYDRQTIFFIWTSDLNSTRKYFPMENRTEESHGKNWTENSLWKIGRKNSTEAPRVYGVSNTIGCRPRDSATKPPLPLEIW